MTENEKLHSALLDILSVTQQTLLKHGIKPFLVAGSCLGAVRHGGIIPWDDDIDVGLIREDYEKAREILINELPEGYTYCDERTEKDYPYNFGKVRKDGTAFVHGGDSHLDIHQGIYMDIFPFDAIPDDRNEFLSQYRKSLALRRRVDLKCMSYRKNGKLRPLVQLPVILAGHLLVNKSRTQKKLSKVISAHSQKRDTRCLCPFLGIYGEKDHLDREWLNVLIEVPFGSITAFIPEKYDEYLTRLYGDYMTPPPEDKRVSHHDVIFMSFEEEYKN